jgi:hypothetical protein
MREGMEIKVTKRGGPPVGEDEAVLEEAIREVANRIDGFDADTLRSAYMAKMQPGEVPPEEGMTDGPPQVASKEECPECAAGECANPEHMDEDTLKAMLSDGGGGAE